MRVLLVSQEVPPETDWGGIGTYVGTIAPALRDAGADVSVLSVVRHQRPSDVVREGIRIRRTGVRRPPAVGLALRLPETWARLSLAAAVAREVARLAEDYSIVEAPEWNAEGLGLALVGARPLVVRLHSSAADARHAFAWGRVDGRLAARAEFASVRRAQVVTSSRSHLTAVKDRLRLQHDATRAIYYPIPEREAGAADPEEARVLFVGRLEARKNPSVLIRAAPRVLRRVPEARFAFAGRGGEPGDPASDAGRLLALAKQLGVAHAVELLGHLPHDQAMDQMSRASVCAFPSRGESFGLVAAEAASLGRPVVASRIPAFEDYLDDGETARLVEPDDANAWGDALIEVLTKPEQAAARGAAARAAISTLCSPQRVARATLDAYELALARWSVRPRLPATASLTA